MSILEISPILAGIGLIAAGVFSKDKRIRKWTESEASAGFDEDVCASYYKDSEEVHEDTTSPEIELSNDHNGLINPNQYIPQEHLAIREDNQNSVIDNKEVPRRVEKIKVKFSTMDCLTEDIISLIEDKEIYLSCGIKVDDLARICNTNRTYISYCINRHYGMTFVTLMNSFRVEHAKYLIANTNMKLWQVCSQSGFSDEVSFIRNFKKMTGQTPSDFANSVSKEQYLN